MTSATLRSRGLVAVLLVSSLFSLSACDQNLDDYRRSKVAENLGRIQEVSGTYNGRLYSATNNEALGDLTIQISPTTTTIDSSDKTGTEQQAGTRVIVTYTEQGGSTSFTFNAADYDATSKTLRGASSWQAYSYNTTLELEGALQDQTLTGTLALGVFRDRPARFEVTKGATPSGQGLQSGAPVPPQFQTSEYSAHVPKFETDGQPGDVALNVTVYNSNNELLLNNLSPLRVIDVTMQFILTVESPSYVASAALYDSRTGAFSTTLKSVTNQNATVRLNCQAAREGWICTAESNRFTKPFFRNVLFRKADKKSSNG